MMKLVNKKQIFLMLETGFFSFFAGITIWLFLYYSFPFESVETFHNKTIILTTHLEKFPFKMTEIVLPILILSLFLNLPFIWKQQYFTMHLTCLRLGISVFVAYYFWFLLREIYLFVTTNSENPWWELTSFYFPFWKQVLMATICFSFVFGFIKMLVEFVFTFNKHD